MKNRNPIEKAKKNILKYAPWIQDIELEIKRVQPDGFRTSIEVKTPKETLFAKKIDRSFTKSIDKCSKAVLKQLNKRKGFRIQKWKPNLVAEFY